MDMNMCGIDRQMGGRKVRSDMGRLTQKEASGRWQVKGIPWEELEAGVVLSKETSQTLFRCLCKLKDYEDTGMSPYEIGNFEYELTDMAEHVCDDLCHYRQEMEMTDQEELDSVCEGCPVSTCLSRLIELEGGAK